MTLRKTFQHHLGQDTDGLYINLKGPTLTYLSEKFQTGVVESVVLDVDVFSFCVYSIGVLSVGKKMWDTVLEPEIKAIQKVQCIVCGPVREGKYEEIFIGLPHNKEWAKPKKRQLAIIM